jgi:hypothetical protein
MTTVKSDELDQATAIGIMFKASLLALEIGRSALGGERIFLSCAAQSRASFVALLRGQAIQP